MKGRGGEDPQVPGEEALCVSLLWAGRALTVMLVGLEAFPERKSWSLAGSKLKRVREAGIKGKP